MGVILLEGLVRIEWFWSVEAPDNVCCARLDIVGLLYVALERISPVVTGPSMATQLRRARDDWERV
jgi:hypothetical protein